MLVSIKDVSFHAVYAQDSLCTRITRPALARLGVFHPDLARLSSMQLLTVVNGATFICCLDLHIAEGLPAEIVLGADWNTLRIAVDSDPCDTSVSLGAEILPDAIPPSPTLSVSQSADAAVLSSEAVASVGLSILYDNFFAFNKSRSRTSIFDANLRKIHHLMALHGLRNSPENIVECRRILISHLLTGACAEFNIHGPNGPHSACRKVCEDVYYANDITVFLLGKLVSAKSKDLSTDRLELVASCFHIYTADRDSRRRQHLQEKRRVKLTILEAGPLSATDVSDAFNTLATKTISSLISLCSLHGVDLPPKRTKDSLRDCLFMHGCCKNANYDGGRNKDDGLAKLRRILKAHIHTLRKGKGSKPASYEEKIRERLDHEEKLEKVREEAP
ncbi:hypothetical protein GGX14DRAFT_394071 [Mycena pura]|uniref:Uncharacterized protein n=1 Tax=Mycena pura TaxID=153505 RepID=A0AAD6YIA6_9AGAR|nr:hypothetical protein GGX14DRAFT_394071 [Mycena pura]